MRDASTALRACVNSTTLNTTAPVGVIQNSLFTDNGAGGTTNAVNHSSCDTVGECACTTTEHYALLEAQRAVLSSADAAVEAIGGNTFPPTGLVPVGGTLPDTHPAADCTQINGSFVSAPYIGGFEPGGADWTAGWTEYPANREGAAVRQGAGRLRGRIDPSGPPPQERPKKGDAENERHITAMAAAFLLVLTAALGTIGDGEAATLGHVGRPATYALVIPPRSRSFCSGCSMRRPATPSARRLQV
jgi:hypothetical protein